MAEAITQAYLKSQELLQPSTHLFRAYLQKTKEYVDAAEKADNAINNKAAAYEALKADPVFQELEDCRGNGLHGDGNQEGACTWCHKSRPETRQWNPKRARAHFDAMNFHVDFVTHAHLPQTLQVLGSQPVIDSSGSSEQDLSRAPAATGSQPAKADPDGSDGESSGVWKGHACAPPQAADKAADKHRQPQSKAAAIENLKTAADKPATDAKTAKDKAAAADAKKAWAFCHKQAGYVPATPPAPALISCSYRGPPPLGPRGGQGGWGPTDMGPPP